MRFLQLWLERAHPNPDISAAVSIGISIAMLLSFLILKLTCSE